MSSLAAPIAVTVFAVSYFLVLMFWIFPALDRQEAATQVINDKSAAECRQHGGVPVMSAWDGRLNKCEGISHE